MFEHKIFILNKHLQKKMNRIVINENIEQEFINNVLSEALCPSAEKVLIVKDFIDKNFAKTNIDDIDANGYPTKNKMVNMLSGGQPIKTMNLAEFLLMLDDKFHNMISDGNDRKKFLKQIIKDWYTGKLPKNGILSVNFIK